MAPRLEDGFMTLLRTQDELSLCTEPRRGGCYIDTVDGASGANKWVPTPGKPSNSSYLVLDDAKAAGAAIDSLLCEGETVAPAAAPPRDVPSPSMLPCPSSGSKASGSSMPSGRRWPPASCTSSHSSRSMKTSSTGR